MKRIITFLLCTAMLLTTSACGAKKDTEAPKEEASQVAADVSEAEESKAESEAEESEAEESKAEESEAEETEKETDTGKTDKFTYKHDPRENPKAMEDIVENPEAVYGFSPNPDSTRLGSYAEYDWTDPEVVEKGREDRILYHESLDSLYTLLHDMRDKGASIEEMARAVSAERNRLRLESYNDDPEGLEAVKKSNLETYGDENGPSADSLYEKYGSWETVLQKAFGTNMGMDACTGLYDDYYDLYIELGMITE